MTMQPSTVLITGASSGIGLELAHIFAEHGDNLVLVARDEDPLEKLARTLSNQYGLRVEAIAMDLTRPGAVKKLIDMLKKERLEINTLVNNAGFGLYGEATKTDWAIEQNMITLNIEVVTELSKHFGRQMLERGHGEILNVASTASFFPGVHMSVYYATKAYVLSYTLALAEELSRHGVVVTALCPGPTKSGFAQRSHASKTRLFGKTMSARSVAQAGYRGLKRRRRVVVTGARNKFAVSLSRVLPRRTLAAAVRKAS